MEEGMDSRRGPPLMGGNRWSSADMNYQPGSSSGGSGSNSLNRMTRLEEAGESSSGGRVGSQETGKGPECSRPPVRKPNQVSPKLVAARSSGGRRVQRPHHGSLPGQWNVLQGFSEGLNEGGLDSVAMDGDGNLGMGLNTHLSLSEEIIVHPAHLQSLSNSESFLGRGGRPLSNNALDFLTGRVPMQGSNTTDLFAGRAGGLVGDNMSGRSGASGLPPIGNRQAHADAGVAYHGSPFIMEERTPDGVGRGMTFNTLFMERQELPDGGRNGLDERRVDNGSGSMTSNSLLLERPEYISQDLLGSSSNFMGASDTVLAAVNRNPGLFENDIGCSTDGRHYGADRHSFRGNVLGTSFENTAGSFTNVTSSSRSSACKRKSCTPVGAGALSCRNGSPHRTGFRENYSGRAGGGSGVSRRTSGIGGCTSGSDIVASTSSPTDAGFMGRYAEPSVAASSLEEPPLRRTNYVREPFDLSPEYLRDGRSGKSVAGGSSTGVTSQRTSRNERVGVVLSDPGAAQPSPTFARTVRRAVPSPDNWGSRRATLTDSSMDADEGISSSSLLVDQMLSASQPRRSGSPLLGGGRSGTSGSPRRSDPSFNASTLGERFTHRYFGNSTRSLATSASSANQLGAAVATESRLRSRGINHSNFESMSLTAPPPTEPVSLTMQTAVSPALPSTPSPSRPPPHPPVLRGRLQGSSVHTLLPSPSGTSGPAPSRLPPSPPPLNPLSFAPSTDSLPSPSSLFQGSLLPRASPAGVRERGFTSAAESLLGMPFRGLQMSAGDGGHQPRLVAEGIAEGIAGFEQILLALERVERDEDLTYEQLLMLEATLLFGGMGLHDQHSDLRLDVDNMTYEELLALEERIGNVSTGVTTEVVAQKLKRSYYSSLDVVVARFSQECDIKCSICQEEYEEGDELGKIDCGHGYHVQCIQQWLVQKNQCPICKAAAFS